MALSVGGIISKSFGMMKERLGPLLGMWAVYFAILLILMFVLVAGMGASVGMLSNLENPGSFGVGMVLSIVIFYLAYILLYCAQAGSLSALSSPLQNLDFGAAFVAGWRGALSLLGVTVLLGIGYVVAAIPLSMLATGATGARLGGLVLFLLFAFIATRLFIIVPTIAVEGVRNPITVISRSWNLTRGNALSIFLAMLVFIAIAVVLFVIAILPVGGAVASIANGTLSPASAMGGMAFTFIGVLIISIFLAIFGAVMQSVIHAQLAGTTAENLTDTFN